MTTVFGALDVGSAVGLMLCPPLIANYGWPSVFWIFAVMGLVWSAFWPRLRPEDPDPRMSPPPPPSGEPQRSQPASPGCSMLRASGADAEHAACCSCQSRCNLAVKGPQLFKRPRTREGPGLGSRTAPFGSSRLVIPPHLLLAWLSSSGMARLLAEAAA